jgi:HEAT repeat protein
MKTARVVLAWIVWGWLAMGGLAAQPGEASMADLLGGLKSPDEAARLRAIDQLGARGEKAAEAVTPLTELLKDGSAKVRAHAVWALGAIGAAAKPAVAAMAELAKDPDETVRRQVARAVMAIHPGPQVTIPLAIKLLEDPDPAVRVRILHAIAEAGAPAVPALIEALKNDKAAYWACIVLREIGPDAKDAVPALAEKLKDPRPEIRREAALTLGAMGEAAIAVLPQIAALLGDEHARTAATFVLGELGQIPASAEAIVRAAAKSDDKMLATTSLWALARVHPEDKDLRRQVTEQLIARLADKDPFVRAAAARGLAALPPAPEITIPIWEKVLQNADETTMHYALDALATLGAPAVPRLIDALQHEKLRGEVASILGRMGPAAAPATSALAKLIDDKRASVAGEAILALANIGPGAKDAVPALVKALQQGEDKDPNFCSIVYALGKIGPDAAAAQPVLLDLLKNPDRNLALMSAWALTHIQGATAESAAKTMPVLIEGLAFAMPQSRQLAAEALGGLGPLAKDAGAALQKASTDEDKAVRAAVAQALAAIVVTVPKSGAAAKIDRGVDKQAERDAVAKAMAAVKEPLAKVAINAPKPIAAGDVVVTRGGTVALRAGSAVVAQLPAGSHLKVIELRAPWVAVQATIDGKSKTGWVLQADVAKP